MTKPFESIRNLFGRVLGSNSAGEETGGHEFSTLGITSPAAQPATNGNGHAAEPVAEISPEIEVQTADTQRLPRVAPESFDSRNDEAGQQVVAADEGADEFGDALLDLGEVRGPKAFVTDDPFLDVLDDTTTRADVASVPEATVQPDVHESVTATFSGDTLEAAAPVIAESEHWPVATENVAVEAMQPESEVEESVPASVASPASLSDLSPEVIDAIAQRVVAQLSDKVVKEIAWEVVPELAELLIKRKLEEK